MKTSGKYRNIENKCNNDLNKLLNNRQQREMTFLSKLQNYQIKYEGNTLPKNTIFI